MDETKIQEAIGKLIENKTVLIIVHKLYSMQNGSLRHRKPYSWSWTKQTEGVMMKAYRSMFRHGILSGRKHENNGGCSP